MKAAGGAITNLNNEEIIFGKSNFEQGGIIVATNNAANHEKICFDIRAIIEKFNLYPFKI